MSFFHVERIFRWTRSALCRIWSLSETGVFWAYGEKLLRLVFVDIRRLQGGWMAFSSGEGEAIGEMGRASALAVEL